MQVNLPKADTKGMNAQEDTVIVAVDLNGRTFINKDEVPAGDLRQRLSELFATRTKKRSSSRPTPECPTAKWCGPWPISREPASSVWAW